MDPPTDLSTPCATTVRISGIDASRALTAGGFGVAYGVPPNPTKKIDESLSFKQPVPNPNRTQPYSGPATKPAYNNITQNHVNNGSTLHASRKGKSASPPKMSQNVKVKPPGGPPPPFGHPSHKHAGSSWTKPGSSIPKATFPPATPPRPPVAEFKKWTGPSWFDYINPGPLPEFMHQVNWCRENPFEEPDYGRHVNAIFEDLLSSFEDEDETPTRNSPEPRKYFPSGNGKNWTYDRQWNKNRKGNNYY